MSSTLCAIVKNEAPYLAEWAHYHRMIGFDRIIVYENDSDDDTPAILAQLRQDGVIDQWVPWPHVALSPQFRAYADAAATCATDWLMFLDADEFLSFADRRSVADFLREFDAKTGCVAINWRIFGSSGQQDFAPGLVIERFLRAGREDHPVHRHVKSFFRPRSARAVHMHAPLLARGAAKMADGAPLTMSDHGLSDQVDWSIAKIHHYFDKSKQEFLAKRRRGDVLVAADHPDKYAKYTDHVFDAHDLNDEFDDSLLWAAPRLRELMFAPTRRAPKTGP